jgi:hypothetical protein
MRQHPIPQNVLDIEFKLFTRFTLKEFAYLALGVGTGGIFLYLSIGGDIPGVVGIPIFAILSFIGTFLALVPINDQPADKFFINYFNAINKPTQRVWLNQTMKEQRIKPQLVPQNEEAIVIGGSKIAPKTQIFEETPGDDILEEVKEETNVISEPIESKPSQSISLEDEYITITEENISTYQFPIKSIDKLPGNINIWLCSKENQPLSNVNTYLKDSNGKILYANKTGPNGYFLTNRTYPEGTYTIEFEGLSNRAPKLRLFVTNSQSKLPLKITLK